MLRKAVTEVAKVTEVPKQDIRALDACGGSGYASNILLDMGVKTTLVDISPEMLDRWRRKARSRGHEADAQEYEIRAFLAQSKSRWDLIVFSSALHHIENYLDVLSLASTSLAPGGVLVTLFDPVSLGRVGRRIRRVDWIANAVLHDRALVLKAAWGKLRRAAGSGEPAIGRLAERHALTGIDDEVLVGFLREHGLAVVLHEHEFWGRLAPTRAALRLLRAPSTFHIIAQRRGGEAPAASP